MSRVLRGWINYFRYTHEGRAGGTGWLATSALALPLVAASEAQPNAELLCCVARGSRRTALGAQLATDRVRGGMQGRAI
ncbi:MAG: hypothetical protein VB137_10630 [Burkholderia sp.]